MMSKCLKEVLACFNKISLLNHMYVFSVSIAGYHIRIVMLLQQFVFLETLDNLPCRPPYPPCLWGRGHVPINIGTRCFARAGEAWQGIHSMLRVCGLAWFRKGAACLLYLPYQIALTCDSLVLFFFFWIGFPLKIHTRTSSRIRIWYCFLFILMWGFPLISTPDPHYG